MVSLQLKYQQTCKERECTWIFLAIYTLNFGSFFFFLNILMVGTNGLLGVTQKLCLFGCGKFGKGKGG